MLGKSIFVRMQRSQDSDQFVLQWIDPFTGHSESKSAETSIAAIAEMKRTEREHELKRAVLEHLLNLIDFHQLRDVEQRALDLGRFRHVPAVFADAEATDGSDRISMLKIKPVRRQSLVDTVVQRIREVIEQGHLRAGDRLPTEAELGVQHAGRNRPPAQAGRRLREGGRQ